MRGYVQVVSTLLFFAVLYWLATRSTRRARKAERRARTWATASTPEQRLHEVEQVTVHQDDRLTDVERRLAALEGTGPNVYYAPGEVVQPDPPLYRVQ